MKRTIIYIDGFNLYYGSLKGTPYKWLDLKQLFENLLDNTHQIVALKYFTAKLSDRKNNQDAISRQQIYCRALKEYIPELTLYYGHYLTHPVILPLADLQNGKKQFVKVLKSEGKGSDVNMALHILNDAWLDAYDCAIIVTNDSNLAKSLRLVKHHHKKMIGLIPPGNFKKRHPSKELKQHCDFMKEIREGVLRVSQLPEKIPATNLTKPDKWY